MPKKLSPSRALETWLRSEVKREDAAALKPLPATRALGERFKVSHGTAFRVLQRLEREGKAWRHPNGRFYPMLAGRVLGRTKPLAVMLRRMHAWSFLCKEIMDGFTDECSERDRPVLLFPHKGLLLQKAAEQTVQIAAPSAQRLLLKEFALLHGDAVGGVLFDEIWRDEVIDGIFPPDLPLASFSRPSRWSGVASVVPDYEAGALLAIGHLLASGYEKIVLIDPLPDYEPAKLFLKTALSVYGQLSQKTPARNDVVQWHRPDQRSRLIRRLIDDKTRVGLLCPEDNVSAALAASARDAGVKLGPRHGLVSVMGTRALAPGEITCMRYDFEAMGRVAASMLCDSRLSLRKFAPRLDAGQSTSRS